MAERAFETPHHFSEYIVLPNIDDFKKRPNSLQAAFNCVMSIDSLAGHIFLFFKDMGELPADNDSHFRDILAKCNEHYRIIRDAAKTYKHIELDRPAIIRVASQTKVAPRPYGSGGYGVGSYGGKDVMIELNDGTIKHCLSEALAAHDFLQSNF